PGVALRREVLAELLWPDAGERSRRALSGALYRLRRQVGDGWIDPRSDAVALAGGVSVDVWEFDRLAGSHDPADLEEAVDLYRDELLPAVYDDWAREPRTARHLALLAALGRLAEHRERTGDLERAVLDVRR